MQLIRSAMLVAVLLIAQAGVAAHVDVDDSHPTGETCALCAGASVLGSANVGAAVQFHATAHVAPALAGEPNRHGESRHIHFLARGPPSAS